MASDAATDSIVADLADARAEIDALDHLLVELLIRRYTVAGRIGRLKRERGLPVFDPAREAALLARLSEQARPPLTPDALVMIWETLLEVSRAVQEEIPAAE